MTIGITGIAHDAAELRRLATRTRDVALSRRLLALTLVLEGERRADAARRCGMDRQTTSGDCGIKTWPNRAGGWPGWCADTSPITPCQPTAGPWRHSATTSSISGGVPCAGAARGTGRPGPIWTGWRLATCQGPGSPIRGPLSGFASNTQDGSRMRECRMYGSVRGAPSNGRPYRDPILPTIAIG